LRAAHEMPVDAKMNLKGAHILQPEPFPASFQNSG
jgi:hypothetical protein